MNVQNENLIYFYFKKCSNRKIFIIFAAILQQLKRIGVKREEKYWIVWYSQKAKSGKFESKENKNDSQLQATRVALGMIVSSPRLSYSGVGCYVLHFDGYSRTRLSQYVTATPLFCVYPFLGTDRS